MIVGDGTKIAVILRFDEMPHEIPMLQKLADPPVMTRIPTDKGSDNGTQNPASESRRIKYCVIPLDVDHVLARTGSHLFYTLLYDRLGAYLLRLSRSLHL